MSHVPLSLKRVRAGSWFGRSSPGFHVKWGRRWGLVEPGQKPLAATGPAIAFQTSPDLDVKIRDSRFEL